MVPSPAFPSSPSFPLPLPLSPFHIPSHSFLPHPSLPLVTPPFPSSLLSSLPLPLSPFHIPPLPSPRHPSLPLLTPLFPSPPSLPTLPIRLVLPDEILQGIVASCCPHCTISPVCGCVVVMYRSHARKHQEGRALHWLHETIH